MFLRKIQSKIAQQASVLKSHTDITIFTSFEMNSQECYQIILSIESLCNLHTLHKSFQRNLIRTENTLFSLQRFQSR